MEQLITPAQIAQLQTAALEAKAAKNRPELIRVLELVQLEIVKIFNHYGINQIAIPWAITGTKPYAKFKFIRLMSSADKGAYDDVQLQYAEGDGYRIGSNSFIGYMANPQVISWILHTIDLNKAHNIPVTKWQFGHNLL